MPPSDTNEVAGDGLSPFCPVGLSAQVLRWLTHTTPHLQVQWQCPCHVTLNSPASAKKRTDKRWAVSRAIRNRMKQVCGVSWCSFQAFVWAGCATPPHFKHTWNCNRTEKRSAFFVNKPGALGIFAARFQSSGCLPVMILTWKAYCNWPVS